MRRAQQPRKCRPEPAEENPNATSEIVAELEGTYLPFFIWGLGSLVAAIALVGGFYYLQGVRSAERAAAPAVTEAAPNRAEREAALANAAKLLATPTPQVDITKAFEANLRRLWLQGSEAKHRGDYAAARRSWEAALRLAPRHFGFQEAIDKLPKSAGSP